MELVDAQLHVWDRDHPDRPWAKPTRNAQRMIEHITYDEMARLMDVAGVDAAIIATPAIYGNDNSYLLAAAEHHPRRFRVVGRVDPGAPDVEEQVTKLASHPYAVGVRLIARSAADAERLGSGGFAPMLHAAQRHGLVVCVLSPGFPAGIQRLARAHPDLRVAVDHLGLAAPPSRGTGSDFFSGLSAVLELASSPNLVLKLTGAPALSSHQFPYPDLWPHLTKIIDAFGPDRLMWGSDWTRVPNATYKQGVRYVDAIAGLSPPETALIMGQTLRRVFGWPAQ